MHDVLSGRPYTSWYRFIYHSNAVTERLKYTVIRLHTVQTSIFHYVMVTFVPFLSYSFHIDIMPPSTGRAIEVLISTTFPSMHESKKVRVVL